MSLLYVCMTGGEIAGEEVSRAAGPDGPRGWPVGGGVKIRPGWTSRRASWWASHSGQNFHEPSKARARFRRKPEKRKPLIREGVRKWQNESCGGISPVWKGEEETGGKKSPLSLGKIDLPIQMRSSVNPTFDSLVGSWRSWWPLWFCSSQGEKGKRKF